jgi:hypothetical protein
MELTVFRFWETNFSTKISLGVGVDTVEAPVAELVI